MNELLRAAIAQGSWLVFPMAFVGGVLMGLNPCCLALFPAVGATCCAADCRQEGRSVPWKSALAFVVGTAAAMALLGLLAGWAGRGLAALPSWTRAGLGLVPILVGLHLLGWLPLPRPAPREARMGQSLMAAFTAGLGLSIILGSCGTPVLAALLSFAALQASPVRGGATLFIYGLGNGLPLVLVGTLASGLTQRWLQGRGQKVLERFMGASLIVLGYAMVWILA